MGSQKEQKFMHCIWTEKARIAQYMKFLMYIHAGTTNNQEQYSNSLTAALPERVYTEAFCIVD